MKFPINDFFNKWDHIRSFLQIWLNLWQTFVTENFIFCAVKLWALPWIIKLYFATLNQQWKFTWSFFLRFFEEYFFFYIWSLFLYSCAGWILRNSMLVVVMHLWSQLHLVNGFNLSQFLLISFALSTRKIV